MRVYTAGFYGATGKRTVNAIASRLANPEWVLESYYYLQSKREGADEIREAKGTIFLDSGAFSMFTQGVEVDLASFAKFILEEQDIIHLASNLDVIGAGSEQGTWNNQKALEAMGVKVQPVHHARDSDKWLQRYLDEGYEAISLGGMVPENTTYLRDWLDHIWDRFLTKPDGSARVKVHGFGLTVTELMLRYPWYSVDSTSWVLASRYGGIFLDLPERNFKVDFSDQSSKQYEDGSWHYTVLKPAERKRVNDRLEELEEKRIKNPQIEEWLEEKTGVKQGYRPDALAKLYGWRDAFNIGFFTRMQDKAPKTFKRPQPGLFV